MRTCLRNLSGLAVAACLLGGALPARAEAPAEPGARETNQLRVLNYNIRHGRGMDDEIDLERIAGVINAADADIVALQEVDVGVRRSGEVDQVAELGRLTDMYGVFGKHRDFGGGDYGQALLSRRPIESVEVIDLHGTTGEDADYRVAVAAHIPGTEDLPGILFVSMHLHHQAEEHRLLQVRELKRVLGEAEQEAVILAGDLNARPGSETANKMLDGWIDTTPDDAMTFPADEPNRKIDYILFPEEHPWRVLRSEVIDEPMASDHRPLYVDLEWSPGR